MKQHTSAMFAPTPPQALIERAPAGINGEPFRRSSFGASLPSGVRRLMAAAQHGIAAAQNCLGEAFGNGIGVKRDDQAALLWIRKAAEQGYAPAQNNLGFVHALGRGVDQDELQAVAWFRKAAEQGHADAIYNLGAAHLNPRGRVRQDLVLAYMLFSLAAGTSSAAAAQCDRLQLRLNREQLAEAQAMLRNWKPHDALPTRSKTGSVLA